MSSAGTRSKKGEEVGSMRNECLGGEGGRERKTGRTDAAGVCPEGVVD